MLTSILLCLGSFLTGATVPNAADFYVAANGSDTNPGTLEKPFATMGHAKEAVRALIRDGLKRDVKVLVREGGYTLDAPLVFTPEDSGTAEFAVTYAAWPGENPFISGARAISGWKAAGNNQWTVELPEVKAGKWAFRQLFADAKYSHGGRLPRGRFPNGTDLLTVKSVSDDVKEIVLSEAPSAGNLAGKGAELVVFQNWSISRAPIAASEGDKVVTTVPVGWIGHGPMTTTSPGKPCYVENALAFVDQPGEWYLDGSTGVLTYQAAAGEDPNTRKFVAPAVQQLVVVGGKPDAPVRNLRFEGLYFAYTEWVLPSFGYMGIQAGHHGTTTQGPISVLPLALEFRYAQDCRITKCTVSHTGASGMGFGAGCRGNVVADCDLFDIGGSGVMVGWRGKGGTDGLVGDAALSKDWDNPSDVPTDNEVSNCVIRRCGAVNHGCVGVFDAFSNGTKIRHNEVTDMPYTGISVGFRWDSSPTSQQNALVEYNHIHDVMKVLADGGGIYTLGLQPGTVLRGNVIHQVHRSGHAQGGAPNNGIFFDEGSKGFLVEGQVIYDTSGEPIRFNQTSKENLNWKDNSLGVSPGDPAFPVAAVVKAGPEPGHQR